MKYIVGEDLGYGYDKAVTEGRAVTLESILGPAVTIKYHNDLIANGHGLEVALRGKGWFVGELARLQSPFTVSPRARERDPEIVQILSLAALYALGITDGEVYLGTGLPVAWYQDREQLTHALVGHHTPVINGQRCDLEIVDALVIPQPFGSFFRLLLNPAGVLVDQDSLARERVAVLDIGTHTTDYALADGLRYVEPKSGSIPVAMARVYELVQRSLATDYHLELRLPDVETAVQRGSITLYGQRQGIGDLVQHAVDAVAQEIVGEARTLWGDGRDLAAVLITGGGGLVFQEHVQAVYPHARLVPEPQLANAAGFYRYALRKFAAGAASV